MTITFTIDLATEIEETELNELDQESREDLARDLAYENLEDQDYLDLLDYDYVAELPHCRHEDEVDYLLSELAAEVQQDSYLELMSVVEASYTFELCRGC